MRLALLLILLLGPPQMSRQAADGPILKAEAISPYLIEWYIDINEDADLRHIWRLLKIEMPGDKPYICGGACSAETFDINLDGEERYKTVALRIFFERADLYQYLIFKRARSDTGEKAEWTFIGRIDSVGQRHAAPAHRVESGNNRSWFVIKELWGRGSGLMAYGDVWYEIKEAGLKRVLSYPVEGSNKSCQGYLGHSYKSILSRHELENGVYTVPIQLLVSYNISDCVKGSDPHPLFTKGHKAYYVWHEKNQRFDLDAARSDISEKDIGIIYSMEGLSYEGFFDYNFNELSEIARRGDREQKEWLTRFLTRIKDGPRKATLQHMLRQ